MASCKKATLIATSATLVMLGVGIYEFHSMLTHTHLPLLAIALLCLPRSLFLAIIWLGWWLSVNNREVKPRWFAAPLLMFAVLFSISIAHRVADHYFLVYLYGSSRVQTEQLHLVRTGKNNPWPVTGSGRQVDLITNHDVWRCISNAAEAYAFFPMFFGIACLLPRKGSGPFVVWIRC